MTVVEDIAKECNLEFHRTPISIEQFESADEVFITSSSGGVTPTTKTGSITDLLIDKYELKKEQYATKL